MGWLIYTPFILLCYSCLPIDVLCGNKTDEEALIQFRAKISDDPLGVFKSWNSSMHFCEWDGVTCSRRHLQRVVRLDLYSKKLGGSISPYIGNLSFLRVLSLYNNSFSHEIPPEISRLRRLQVLELYNNSIGGIIPTNISACSNLIRIEIAKNKLVGKIHVEFGFLLKLQILSIDRNNLTGNIPHNSLGNLSSLKVFSTAYNNLEGPIPDDIGRLKNLYFLSVFQNRLSGNIPLSIFNLSSITVLGLGDNQFNGTLPSNLAITLPNLEIFSMGLNKFTGSIPLSISNASNLVELQVAKNKFTGNVPSLEKLHRLQTLSITSNHLGSGRSNDLAFLSSLANATGLSLLAINDNNLGGLLPESIGNFSTELSYMNLSRNPIFGRIPAGIGNLINLERLEALNNQLSGNIPIEFGKLQKLVLLYLGGNKISGKIPSSLENLTNLYHLSLERNYLQGNIPISLSKCRNLVELDLSENNLIGGISPEVVSFSFVVVLDISQNLLIGSLPTEVGNLKILTALDVSGNSLSSKIPSSLSSCVSLEFLLMQDNFFEGPIPLSLSSLRGIRDLDLSRNNLSGKIPEFLASFKLEYLNLSFNDFEGVVPIEGVFKNESAVSVMNNSKLCGGVPELLLPKCNFKDQKKRTLSRNLKLILSIVSALSGVTFVLSILFLFWLRKKRKCSTENSSGNQLMKVSYGSLLRATNEFSSANLIGVGSFGSVYKGILDLDNMIVAIKVLNLFHPGAFKSFIAECETLRSIRHRNLVKVLTACSGVDYRGNDFKALVYEFMVNGSLDEWLHPIYGNGEVREDPRKLTFLQRLSIAIDIASALEYLHHHCQISIVHCDLKPSNVLLNNELTGHIGDFGLAKFFQEASNNFSASNTSSVGIRGFVGYAPPEYGMGAQVSTYGDVYSYGILLLEMFTGKRPTDDMFKDSLNLHSFVKATLPDRMVEIIDPILLQEIVEGEKNVNNNQPQILTENYRIQDCLISIMRVGVACSTELLRNRMNINDVVVELRLIRDKLLQTSIHGERRTINAL